MLSTAETISPSAVYKEIMQKRGHESDCIFMSGFLFKQIDRDVGAKKDT